MTLRARRRQVRPRQREAGCRMIERRVGPQHRVMALFAGCWEAIVIHGRFCVVVIRLVARDAGRRRNVVVVIDMALHARRGQVRSRQREACRRVVKLAICPHHRVMALLARGREARMRHRCRRVVVIRLVARNARRHRNVVIVVGVALRAGRGQVRARQRPARRCMVKLAIRPQHGVVTLFAGRREACMRYRRGRVVVIRLMAGNARRYRDLVVVVDVALGARRGNVRARQRESRLGMIKSSWLPGSR